MDTAFIIGNGESRNIFPIENLKGKGVIYGCNAIYRDHPMLCDHIVAVNPPMYEELAAWHNNDTKRDGHSSWVCVHSGDKWPCDWTVAPGRSPGTSRERNIHAFCQLA